VTAPTDQSVRGGRPEGGRLSPEERSDVGQSFRDGWAGKELAQRPVAQRGPNEERKRRRQGRPIEPDPQTPPTSAAAEPKFSIRRSSPLPLLLRGFFHAAPARRSAYLINDRRARSVPGSDASPGIYDDHRPVAQLRLVPRSSSTRTIGPRLTCRRPPTRNSKSSSTTRPRRKSSLFDPR
jgi:hypothetical protein